MFDNFQDSTIATKQTEKASFEAGEMKASTDENRQMRKRANGRRSAWVSSHIDLSKVRTPASKR